MMFDFLVAILCFLMLILLSGCSQRVIYKDVLVPTKCDVEMPKRPILSGDVLLDIKEALKHSEILESNLRFCIKGE